ncbi:MAG: class I SAM-dependent methyltransferase [Flavobacteriaceae bacterium]|nr:class I SAM-dependent methyltransferase [Flavobacteriaceae bacterium]
MRRLLLAYLRFLLRSTNQHGIHSPFVYELVNQCFKDRKPYPEYAQLKAYRESVRRDNTVLEITDLGPGSHILKSKQRVVKDIAKNAGSTTRRTQLLFRLVRHFKAQNILELGTSLGIASHAMSLGNPEARIKTIEGCPNLSAYTRDQLSGQAAKYVNILTGDFDEVLDNLEPEKYDLIFIDGNHQKESTVGYFKRMKDLVHNDSVIIFDDINWSKGMQEAWAEIMADKCVRVSIDTFFWGLVFFRKEQAKEHFNIRL